MSPHDSAPATTPAFAPPFSSAVPRVVVFCSPGSGNGANRDQIPRLQRLLAEHGIAFRVTTSVTELRREVAADTSRAGQPEKTVESATPDQSLSSCSSSTSTSTSPSAASRGGVLVVVAGGDGTLALVAANLSPAVPVIPLPMGTENLLARHYGFSADAASTVQTILRGHDRAIDAGCANGRLFLVMVTAGFDAEVVRALHLRRRGHIRKWSYAGPILRGIRKYRFPSIQVRAFKPAGGPAKTPTASTPTTKTPTTKTPTTKTPASATTETCDSGCWAMVFNLPMYGGNLAIEPTAVGDDGLLETIVLRRGGLLAGLGYWIAALRGRLRHRTDAGHDRSTRIRLESDDRVPYQTDGDYAGRLPVEIEILPAHLTLRMPPPGSGVDRHLPGPLAAD